MRLFLRAVCDYGVSDCSGLRCVLIHLVVVPDVQSGNVGGGPVDAIGLSGGRRWENSVRQRTVRVAEISRTTGRLRAAEMDSGAALLKRLP